ncbi:hypothetical protein [Tessaracoccus palaemonis]|uniref:Toxin-antitoxin system protein n=1 Tax=Tessaracoccus palaemonis TaxID=2829499 RepID=A0ABX8SK31_9ACTN|nr:hypothetical protein [Tessaracoccus palaemonis]QXT62353.1 hypothetical protein KDB89_11420 [Tessaracoccus palaemonis]
MSRTTIAVTKPLRERISTRARAEHVTVEQFLNRLLDQEEDRRFWASFEDLTPEKYRAALVEDGDDWVLDADYSPEERKTLEDEADR